MIRRFEEMLENTNKKTWRDKRSEKILEKYEEMFE